MHTFLFQAGGPVTEITRTLESAARVVQSVMPSFGYRLDSRVQILSENNCGWAIIGADDDPWPALATDWIHEIVAVVAFGETQGLQSPAKEVGAAFLRGGSAAVRGLGGCVSAIVVDRRHGNVLILSDVVSRRTLRWFETNEAFFVSPHDVALVATGRLDPRIDLVSACSSLGVQWSIGGRPHLEGVRACRPFNYVRWSQHAGAEALRDFPSIGELRRHAGEVAAVRRGLIDAVVKAADRHTLHADRVIVDLTAGLDSRAVVAMLIGAGLSGKMMTVCTDVPESLDWTTAAQLAAIHGLRFKGRSPETPSPDVFLNNADVLAFYMNGDTCAKRSLAVLRYPTEVTPHVGGAGGETFRGTYYPRATDSPANYLINMFTKAVRQLPWSDEELPAAVHLRIEEAVEELAGLAHDPWDILDLFYVYERLGVWGALLPRIPWFRARVLPFCDPLAFLQSLKLPAPIGANCLIHEALIRRYMPSSCWIPINGKRSLALEGNNSIRKALRFGMRPPSGRKDVGAKHAGKSVNELRHEILMGPFKATVIETLLDSDSIGAKLMGAQAVERLFQDSSVSRKLRTETIGTLVTMQRWLGLIKEARRLAMNGTAARQ